MTPRQKIQHLVELSAPQYSAEEEEIREAEMVSLIEFNLTLTPAERVQKGVELAEFFQRVQRIAAKRYKRKVDIQAVGLA